MDHYLKGLRLLNLLQSQYLDMHEKLIRLKSTYESDVETRCCLSPSGSDNNKTLYPLL